MRRITDRILARTPLTYAVRYVETDGTQEVDFWDCMTGAQRWADWCQQDGCTDVSIDPIYSEREIAAARH